MKQIRYIEWYHPSLYGSGPFGIKAAMLMGLVRLGYVYDHEGD